MFFAYFVFYILLFSVKFTITAIIVVKVADNIIFLQNYSNSSVYINVAHYVFMIILKRNVRMFSERKH